MLRAFPVIACLAAVAQQPVAAEDVVFEGNAGLITAEGWSIAGFESDFTLSGSDLAGEVRIARITLTESDQNFDNLTVACARLELTTHGVTCSDATFTATLPVLGRQTVPGTFAWHRPTATARLALRGVAVAGSRVRVDVVANDAGVEAKLSGQSLQLEGLLALTTEFTNALAGYSGGGRTNVSVRLSMPADGPLRVEATMDLDAASLANDAGTVAAADVTGRVAVDATVDPDATHFDLEFHSAQGEAYLEPAYANFSEYAFHLRADDVRTSDFAVFDVDRFEIYQDTLLDAGGTAMMSFPSDEDEPASLTADVTLRDSSVANLYASFLRVKLAGTILGTLDTDGRVSGIVRLADSALQSAALELSDVILDDQLGRFAIYGLDGVFNWHADSKIVPAPSRLSWQSGTAYNLIAGAGNVRLQLGDNDVELLEPVRVPFLGGALRINDLVLRNYGEDSATGRLDAELEPVQLGQLTGAFGWPTFSGKLSGRLPLLQLSEDTVTVGGALSANLFDGTMTISNLRIEQPFGRVPRLFADVAIRDLDLLRVTETFSFGDIQGRLSGDVTGLQLENWRTVAMDLYFYTPMDDRSQHRISQRAVENLASVGGGGAAAVLSTGFLQFFEVFAYDRIGLRCVLRNGVCAMSGVGPAKAGPQGTGYYIVKGRGVPRIDVVGYRDTVSWPRLVRQLSAITRSAAPAVR